MGELGVYASFVKDVFYATAMLIVYKLVKYPVWYLFFGHIGTWLAFIMYYGSSGSGFWGPTAATVVTLFVVALDCFILINTVCYLKRDLCCVHGYSTAPFSLGEQVCVPQGSAPWYTLPTLAWLGVSTVGMGIVNGVMRVGGIFGTRQSVSLEMGLSAAYILLKVYILLWTDISFTFFFWSQSILTMAGHVTGIFLSFWLRFVGVLLFMGPIVIDMLVLVGLTPAISSVGGVRSASGGLFKETSGAIPAGLHSLWLALHFLLIGLSGLCILGTLTRNPSLATPYRIPVAKTEGDTEGGDEGESDAAQFSGYRAGAGSFGAPRHRLKTVL